MVTKRPNFEYKRTIKLAPAIGDWTTIQYQDQDAEEINISSVSNINFDSLPKKTLNYVLYLHYRMAEQVVHQLSQDMDVKVELHTVKASQISYQDFLQAQPENVVQTNFDIPQLGRLNMILDWSLADVMINRLMGGEAEETGATSINDIEKKVLETEAEHFKGVISQAWKGLFDVEDMSLTLQTGRFERDHKVLLREAYIYFIFNIGFGSGELKKLTIGYPSHMIKRLLYLKKGMKDPINQRILLKKSTMQGIPVGVKAVLGRAKLTMKELQSLQVGDVVSLDTPLNTPIEVDLDKETKVFAQPGMINNKLCVQIIFWDGSDSISQFVTSESNREQEDLSQNESMLVAQHDTESESEDVYDDFEDDDFEDSFEDDVFEDTNDALASEQDLAEDYESPEDDFEEESYEALPDEASLDNADLEETPVEVESLDALPEDDLVDETQSLDDAYDSDEGAIDDGQYDEMAPDDSPVDETPEDEEIEDDFSWDDLDDDF